MRKFSTANSKNSYYNIIIDSNSISYINFGFVSDPAEKFTITISFETTIFIKDG